MERIELAKKLGWKHGNPSISDLRCFSPFDSEELHHELKAIAAGKGTLFLCDPNWGHSEHDQLDSLLEQTVERAENSKGWLCVPTGGTSGDLRLVRHDQETICAAVAGFQKHYGLNHINSVGVLPLYHVSGLLSWFRCMLTGGTFIDWDWKELEAGLLPNCKVDDDWVISLVPTQFQRLLDRPKTVDWLRRFRAVIVGGASIWPSLVERAANEKLPISLSYGMTETCAMISASLPENFSAQCANVGKPLPHAEVSLTDEGLVRIKSESVFKGYYPEYSSGHDYTSADLGEWDSQGNLVILGRRDFLIISGGKKIAPSEVEAALLATGLVHEAVVMGMPDPDWGQQVVAFLPERIDEKTEQTLDLLIREALASYKRPRRYVTVSPWPRNAQGKVNREALRKSLLEQ